jgi:hypothetical protein
VWHYHSHYTLLNTVLFLLVLTISLSFRRRLTRQPVSTWQSTLPIVTRWRYRESHTYSSGQNERALTKFVSRCEKFLYSNLHRYFLSSPLRARPFSYTGNVHLLRHPSTYHIKCAQFNNKITFCGFCFQVSHSAGIKVSDFLSYRNVSI